MHGWHRSLIRRGLRLQELICLFVFLIVFVLLFHLVTPCFGDSFREPPIAVLSL